LIRPRSQEDWVAVETRYAENERSKLRGAKDDVETSIIDDRDTYTTACEWLQDAAQLSRESLYASLEDFRRMRWPKGDNAGKFTVLVLERLVQAQWHPNRIIACVLQLDFPMPSLRASEGLDFLGKLKSLTMHTKPDTEIYLLYERLAAQVLDEHNPLNPINADALYNLYQALWHSLLLMPASRTSNLRLDSIAKIFQLSEHVSPEIQRHLEPILLDPAHAVDRVHDLVLSGPGIRIITDVFKHLPVTLVHQWIASVPRREWAGVNATPSQAQHSTRRLAAWMRFVHILDHQKVGTAYGIPLTAVAYKSLALTEIHPKIFAKNVGARWNQVKVKMLLNWIPHHASTSSVSLEEKEAFVHRYRFRLGESLDAMMAHLLSHMHYLSIPNHGIAAMVVDLLYEQGGLSMVLSALRGLRSHGGSLSDTCFLHPFLLRVLRDDSGTSASSLSQGRPTNTVVMRLLRAVWSHTTEPPSADTPLGALLARIQFQHILDCARDGNVVPPSYRERSMDSILPERSEFIHQIVYQYSVDRTRSARQNMRAILYSYKYLKSQKLPLKPLLTKALVQICIVRPLSEKRFVSSRVLTWVCELVARVEGEQVARQIEQVFWVWRGNLIKQSQDKLTESGGTDKAHVNTMKKLGLS
jgi:hypothetical protein